MDHRPATISKAIEKAIKLNLCFFAYSIPKNECDKESGRIEFGASSEAIKGIGAKGFHIAPFDNCDEGRLTIPSDLTVQEVLGIKDCDLPYKPVNNATLYRFPEFSTSQEQHSEEVESIISSLSKSGGGKIVAARCLVDNTDINVGDSFLELFEAYPNAFVYCFHTHQSGLWIGATPEILLKASSNKLSTMALAGTRPCSNGNPSGSNLTPVSTWDSKNREEQQLVTDFILDCLLKTGLNPIAESPLTRTAGPVEHLCTSIHAAYDSDIYDPSSLPSLLSPTPAVCGSDQITAMRFITKAESFQRGYYGGYCGPVDNKNHFSLYVTLRCCRIEAGKVAYFAGGGITSQSKCNDEWIETENKISTLLSRMVVKL